MSEARRKFVEGRRRKHNKRRRTKSELAQEKKRAARETQEYETFWRNLRGVQRQTGCSTQTLKEVVAVVHGKHASKKVTSKVDSFLAKSGGAKVLKLNGCVHCDKHVFLPSSAADFCPKCGGARYNDKNLPNEFCLYFPLAPQLEKLLRLPSFRHLLKHEYRRVSNPDFMTDVFDSPIWKKIMGEPTPFLSRILLQLCVDAIPAFARKHSLSLKPVVSMILSLPPLLRAQASNMLLLMLIPARLKGQSAKKYYDFAATYELNRLHTDGVYGVRVVTFGSTLDTPGRAELLNMQVRHAGTCGASEYAGETREV